MRTLNNMGCGSSLTRRRATAKCLRERLNRAVPGWDDQNVPETKADKPEQWSDAAKLP